MEVREDKKLHMVFVLSHFNKNLKNKTYPRYFSNSESSKMLFIVSLFVRDSPKDKTLLYSNQRQVNFLWLKSMLFIQNWKNKQIWSWDNGERGKSGYIREERLM